MPNYGNPKYWDDRYKQQRFTTFDWLEDYENIKDLLCEKIKKNHKILMLGCGNSELSQKMYDDGFENIVNIDISSVVIEQMKEVNIERSKMTWLEMDALKMQFDDGDFDAVIDKSTIDAILCGQYSFQNTAIMLNEVQRILKTGGVYFVVSYGKPENRLLHFRRRHLKFELSCYILSILKSIKIQQKRININLNY